MGLIQFSCEQAANSLRPLADFLLADLPKEQVEPIDHDQLPDNLYDAVGALTRMCNSLKFEHDRELPLATRLTIVGLLLDFIAWCENHPGAFMGYIAPNADENSQRVVAISYLRASVGSVAMRLVQKEPARSDRF